MKGAVLLPIKQIKYRASCPGHAVEVLDGHRVHVDPTDALKLQIGSTDPGMATVEAARP